MTTGFKDFFKSNLEFGDWVEIARTSSGSYFRFGRVEAIGSTGKLLLRVVHVHSRGQIMVEIGRHRVSYAASQMHLMRKVDFRSIPRDVREFIEQSEYA